MNFSTILSNSAKKDTWDFHRNCTKSVNQCGDYYHLTILSLNDKLIEIIQSEEQKMNVPPDTCRILPSTSSYA